MATQHFDYAYFLEFGVFANNPRVSERYFGDIYIYGTAVNSGTVQPNATVRVNLDYNNGAPPAGVWDYYGTIGDGIVVFSQSYGHFLLTNDAQVLTSQLFAWETLSSVAFHVNNDPTGSVTISGTASEDQVLTLASTVADEDGIDAGSIGYQWLRDGVAISGATGTSYTLTQDDVGAVITVAQSYTDGFGNSHSVTSGATEVVTLGETVTRSVSFALPEGGQSINLVLIGTEAINGTGNAANNTITGNSAANILNGGTGADTLIGGLGDDVYITDGGDRIIEAADAGIDLVKSSVTHSLSANLENLTLTGSSAINGNGNALNNKIRGNAGDNRLDGRTGADTLIGGAGDDIYVTDGGDTISETAGGGSDLVRSSVGYALGANLENLTLTGTAAINGTGNLRHNIITGNGAANTLDGGAGNDSLIGGRGKDLLIGASGSDRFVFNAVTESAIGTKTSDVIADFAQGKDKIDLNAIDAFAASDGMDDFVWNGTSAFHSATQGELRYQKFDKAGSVNDFTMVYLDTDGDAGAEMAIRLEGLYDLTASDFIL